MSKLYYHPGTMGSGKSLELIRTARNYQERGMDILIYKSIKDTREGTDKCIIKSRTGAWCEGNWIYEDTNILEVVQKQLNLNRDIKAIFIDEVQFLEKEQIIQLSDIVTELDIPVLTFGIKSDFRGIIFDAISVLTVYADEEREVRSVCWCGKRAKHNARIVDGKVVKVGEVIQIEGEAEYVALCNKHFKNGQIYEKNNANL